MPELQTPGTFRGEIIEYDIRKGKESKSVGVWLKVRITEGFAEESGEWELIEDGQTWTVEGTLWVINKEGRTIIFDTGPGPAEQLGMYAGWDLEFSSIANNTWEPATIQFSAQMDDYSKKVRLKTIYEFGSLPTRAKVSVDTANTLDLEFGSQLRALVTPPAPKQPPIKKRPMPRPKPVVDGVEPSDDIPF